MCLKRTSPSGLSRTQNFASETAPWRGASLPLLKGYYLSSLTDDDKKEVNENFSVSRKNLIDVFSQNPIQSIILRRGQQALDCLENAVSMDVPESSTPRAAPVSELPTIKLVHKKGEVERAERKRKSSSPSGSSVSAEFSNSRLPPLVKNRKEPSAVREENPYGKNFLSRIGRKHTGRGE